MTIKLEKGMQIPDFNFYTQNDEKMTLSDVFKSKKKTLLLFLRYYGCTICQLDLKEYMDKYHQFKEKGTEVVVFLQSASKIVRESGKDFPYIIGCDPEKRLFEQFEILPAKSMMSMLSFKTVGKMMKAKKAGLVHGEYEGEEKQLPAAFLLDNTGKINFSRYAKNLGDLPSSDDFLNMI